MRVLAFEDSYDIEKILVKGGVDLSDWELLQYWNTMDCFDRVEEFKPDLLLLDHYIPPIKGLEVLRGLRQVPIHGAAWLRHSKFDNSSARAANEAMEHAGADGSIDKFQLAKHEVWKN